MSETPANDMVVESLEFLSSVYNYNHWMARSIEPFLGQKVIEIGCGLGNILQYFLLKEKVFGTDVNPELINFCEQKFKNHINCQFKTCDLFTGEKHFNEEFDTVICLNVLEHIEDDRQALQNLTQCVPRGGTLILLVPAHPSIYGQLDINAGHFRRYVKEDLHTRVEGAGWEVQKSFYFNCIGYFGWGLNSRIKKAEHIPVKQTLIYDRYIVPLQAWFESIVTPWFGQSLIMVSHRK